MKKENTSLDTRYALKYSRVLKQNKVKKRYFYSIKKNRLLYKLEVFRMALFLNKLIPRNKKLVLLCIGSNNMVGDMLGPYSGSIIERCCDTLTVYGTSLFPVNATNLHQYVELLYTKHREDFILAIDACASHHKVGTVIVSNRPIKPASACEFPCGIASVGNASIKGTSGRNFGDIQKVCACDDAANFTPVFVAESVLMYYGVIRGEKLLNTEFEEEENLLQKKRAEKNIR